MTSATNTWVITPSYTDGRWVISPANFLVTSLNTLLHFTLMNFAMSAISIAIADTFVTIHLIDTQGAIFAGLRSTLIMIDFTTLTAKSRSTVAFWLSRFIQPTYAMNTRVHLTICTSILAFLATESLRTTASKRRAVCWTQSAVPAKIRRTWISCRSDIKASADKYPDQQNSHFTFFKIGRK